MLGNTDLVGGHREAAFGNVKQSLGGAAVAAWVVQDSLRHAVGTDIGRHEEIGIGGKRHRARHAAAVEDQGIGRQPRRARGRHIVQVGIQKGLYAEVRRTQGAAEKQVLLVIIPQQRPGDLQKIRAARFAADGLAEGDQLEIDVAL